jgi:hypothetical protein
MVLYFELPSPGENVFLQVMALRVPLVHQAPFYSYNFFLFTFLFMTPYMGYSILLSGLYGLGLTIHHRIRAGQLLLYPDPSQRNDLFLVVGEIHNKCKPKPSETPYWRTIPERARFTARQSLPQSVPQRRAAACTPFAEQILAYQRKRQRLSVFLSLFDETLS